MSAWQYQIVTHCFGTCQNQNNLLVMHQQAFIHQVMKAGGDKKTASGMLLGNYLVVSLMLTKIPTRGNLIENGD